MMKVTTTIDSMFEEAQQQQNAALAALTATQQHLDALAQAAQGPDEIEAWRAREALPKAKSDRDGAQAVYNVATREFERAERARQTSRDAEYAPRRRELLHRLAPAVEALAAVLNAIRRADRDHKARGGGGGWPIPPLSEILNDAGEITGAIRERLARATAEPRPAPDEPRPGMKRVRVVKEFINSDRLNDREHVGLTWLDAHVADEALRKGWAIPAA
jgi:uncharacterized membrane protein YccC